MHRRVRVGVWALAEWMNTNIGRKKWCGVEFRAIKDVIFNKQHDRIMYLRMDEGKVDGVFNTDGYIDANTHTPEQIANFIVERIELLA